MGLHIWLGPELPSSHGKKGNGIRCMIHEKQHINVMPVWCMKGFNIPHHLAQNCCALSPWNEGQGTLWSAYQQPRVSHSIYFESSRLRNWKTFHPFSYDLSDSIQLFVSILC